MCYSFIISNIEVTDLQKKDTGKWLKAIIMMATVISFVLVVILAPFLGKEIISTHSELNFLFWPSLIFIWITALPLFVSFYLFYLISQKIIEDKPFDEKNVTRLTIVSRLALIESALYLIALIMLVLLGVSHISLLLIIIMVMFIALAMAVITAILAHLVDKARRIEIENELTI